MLPFAVLKYNRTARERYLQTAPPHLSAPCPQSSASSNSPPPPMTTASYATVPTAASVTPMYMETPPSYGASAPPFEKQ